MTTAINFLNSNQYSTDMGRNFLVYVTFSKKEANRLMEMADKFKLNKDDFIIFSLGGGILGNSSNSDSEFYYLPRVGLNYVRTLIKERINLIASPLNKISFLFCMDDITHYILKEKTIFANARQTIVKIKYIYNLFF
jgi:hypothetical protein